MCMKGQDIDGLKQMLHYVHRQIELRNAVCLDLVRCNVPDDSELVEDCRTVFRENTEGNQSVDPL